MVNIYLKLKSNKITKNKEKSNKKVLKHVEGMKHTLINNKQQIFVCSK